jgi:hypothetical protein
VPLLLVWIGAVGFLGRRDDGLGMVQTGVDSWFVWASMGGIGVNRSCRPEGLGFCRMEGIRRGYQGSHVLHVWDVHQASVLVFYDGLSAAGWEVWGGLYLSIHGYNWSILVDRILTVVTCLH